MRIEFNYRSFRKTLRSVPIGHLAISEAARIAEELDGMTWDERLALRASQADSDLQQMLEYDVDENGNLKSRISERERRRIQAFYLSNHPQMKVKREAAGLEKLSITIDLKGIQAAEATGNEAMRLLNPAPAAIETTSEEVV